ncbi:amidase [Patescibacteria group bacterium]|nr:MAG: amidase [Patescibacteria group bacterium]
MQKYLLGLVAVMGVAVLSGCGSQPTAQVPTEDNGVAQSDQAAAPATSQTPENTVVIRGSAFDPAELTVKAGTTVTWVNKDPVNHNIKGSGMSSPVMTTSQKFEHTFKAAGTFPYSCGIHPTMTGKVIVVAEDTTGDTASTDAASATPAQ